MKPYYETPNGVLYHGDCLVIMPLLEPVDLVLTDPPYGIGKASWDNVYFDWVESFCLSFADKVCIIPGIWALGQCINQMGADYKWTVAGHKPAAMTNGRIGLNKWQPAVLGGNIPRIGADAFDFNQTVRGEVRQGHPCQKPFSFISWLLYKLSKEKDLVCDPFCGSGTTIAVCEQLKRRWIGIEISEKYCEMTAKRIENEIKQLKMF